jgi:hypothetical protein
MTGKSVRLSIGESYVPFIRGTQRDDFVFIEGRRGTAKTSSILKIILKRAIECPGSRWQIARSTRVRLTDSVLNTLDKQVLPALGLPVPTASGAHRTGYDLPNGSRLIFVALDDISRSQSVEIDGGYISEAVEIDNRDAAFSLAGSMRSHGVYVPFRQMLIDYNPGAPSHWVNKEGEDVPDSLRCIETPEDYLRTLAHNAAPAKGGKIKRIITSWPDNPGYFDTAKWELLPEGKDYIRRLGFLSTVMQKRWIKGLWSANVGTVFPEFDRDTHVIDDFEPPSDWPQALGFDPGYGTTGVLWMCRSPDGGIIAYDGIYEGGKSMEEHCAEINRRNKLYGRNVLRSFGDPNEMFSSRAQGPSCANQAKKYGLRFLPWPADKGSAFDAGVEAVRHLLANAAKSPAESPYLRVCRRCKGLIDNFESWAYKTNAAGDLRSGADQYEDANDHALDPCRGVIQSGFLQRFGGDISE